MANRHYISAEHLTIERIGEIIYNNYKLELSEDAKVRIRRCRNYLDKKIDRNGEPVYGVTTGFGSLCNVSIGKDHLAQLQINLIKSHACGTGERVPNDIVKIMMLLKIQSLSYGYSGCKLDTVQRLVQFFNNDIYPIVYKQGSLGASGDLVPLAHMCLPLVGLGEVEYQGKVMAGEEMLRKKRWKPIELASKEGLALLNGTQNMSAFAVWSLLQAQHLSDWADTIAALSLDAFDGRVEPFNPIDNTKPASKRGWLLLWLKNGIIYNADFQQYNNISRIFFEKKAENALSIGEKFLFLHTFSEGKGRRKEADSSFTSCRYNSVGRVADL